MPSTACVAQELPGKQVGRQADSNAFSRRRDWPSPDVSFIPGDESKKAGEATALSRGENKSATSACRENRKILELQKNTEGREGLRCHLEFNTRDKKGQARGRQRKPK